MQATNTTEIGAPPARYTLGASPHLLPQIGAHPRVLPDTCAMCTSLVRGSQPCVQHKAPYNDPNFSAVDVGCLSLILQMIIFIILIND